jgi:hypothetical protein
MMEIKTDYLNTAEAAQFLKRTPAAIRNLVARHQIPFRRPAGRLIFIRSELVEWIENAPGLRREDMKE